MMTEAVLLVNRWYSTCGNCGLSCDPNERKHDTILGYGTMNGWAGCGAEFTSMKAEYHPAGDELQQLRPDLYDDLD